MNEILTTAAWHESLQSDVDLLDIGIPLGVPTLRCTECQREFDPAKKRYSKTTCGARCARLAGKQRRAEARRDPSLLPSHLPETMCIAHRKDGQLCRGARSWGHGSYRELTPYCGMHLSGAEAIVDGVVALLTFTMRCAGIRYGYRRCTDRKQEGSEFCAQHEPLTSEMISDLCYSIDVLVRDGMYVLVGRLLAQLDVEAVDIKTLLRLARAT